MSGIETNWQGLKLLVAAIDGISSEDEHNKALLNASYLSSLDNLNYINQLSHDKMIDAVLNGIGNTRVTRLFNNAYQVNEYTKFLFDIIESQFNNTPKKIQCDSVIKEAIKIANELPIEKIKDADPETYSKCINHDLSDYIQDFSYEVDNSLKDIPTPGANPNRIDIAVSVGEFYLNEALRNTKSKSKIEKVNNKKKRLRNALKKDGLDFLDNTVSNVTQQLKYLLSILFGVDNVNAMLIAYSNEIVEYLKQGSSINDLYHFFNDIALSSLGEKGMWIFNYFDRMVNLCCIPTISNKIDRISFNLCEKTIKDYWYYGYDHKTRKSIDLTIQYILYVDLIDGKIKNIDYGHRISFPNKEARDMCRIDCDDLWSEKEMNQAKDLINCLTT